MPRHDPYAPLDLLPDLSGKEALLLARLLSRIADELWRTYSVDIGLVLAEEQAHDGPLRTETDELLSSDEDLPF